MESRVALGIPSASARIVASLLSMEVFPGKGIVG